jgi:hypothetical protein
VDSDNDIDILGGNGGAIGWYENPSWTKHVVDQFDHPWGSFLADLDNDNDLDIIITNPNSSEVMWYESP